MTPKSGTLVALVIAALFAAAWLYLRNFDHRADAVPVENASQENMTEMHAERPRILEAPDKGSATGAAEGSVAEPTDRSNSQVGRTPSTIRPAADDLNSSVNLQPSPSDVDGLSVPEGAVFPIAESIEKECASGNDSVWDCSGVQKVLKKIEVERRDMQWAPSMENRIRAAVGAVPGAHIGALACRSTVCAVETHGALLTSKAWTPLDDDLLDAAYVPAYGGETLRVQLFTFERRR